MYALTTMLGGSGCVMCSVGVVLRLILAACPTQEYRYLQSLVYEQTVVKREKEAASPYSYRYRYVYRYMYTYGLARLLGALLSVCAGDSDSSTVVHVVKLEHKINTRLI
jgi:hypothetical protein